MTQYSTRIQVDDLIKVTNLLFNDLKSREISHIDLSHTYYWEVDKSERYDPQKDPKDLDLGDLVHDWERMEQILKDRDMIVSAAFSWLGSIYRAIGEELNY